MLISDNHLVTLHTLDLTLPSPAENLACDEALLEWAEAAGYGGAGILRFWEPRAHFVVLGYANRVGLEMNAEACRARAIPILRRCSGGGSVLQGPGCLNYTLVLPVARDAALESVTGTNRFIMGRHREALARLAGETVAVRGHTDLALGERKFSGNSQRRKRRWVLFHGTFLLDFDPALMAEVLLAPPKPPEYRQRRSHSDFLTRLRLPPSEIKEALQAAWRAFEPLGSPPDALIQKLVADRYGRDDWNLKWL